MMSFGAVSRLVLVLTQLFPPPAAAQDPPRSAGLKLVEKARYVVTTNESVRRVTVSADGWITAVLNDGVSLWMLDPKGVTHRAVFEGVDILTAIALSDHVEFVDTLGQAKIMIAVQSRIVGLNPLPSFVSVRDAVRSHRVWVVAGFLADSAYAVYALDSVVVEIARTMPAGDRRLSLPFSLTAIHDGVLITDVASPFGVRKISSDDGDAALLPAPTETRCAPGDAPGRWYALPTVEFSNGYLRTFTDVLSDRRCIIRYDRKGRELHLTTFDIPLSILGQLPNGDFVAAQAAIGTDIVVLSAAK